MSPGLTPGSCSSKAAEVKEIVTVVVEVKEERISNKTLEYFLLPKLNA